MEWKKGRHVCVTCLKLCLRFGNSSSFPPLFFSLLLSHLHRKVQLALIREAEGKSNWAWDQKHPYGDRLSPATLLTQRQATKTINDFLNESLYFRNGLCNVYECEWQGAGRMLNQTDLYSIWCEEGAEFFLCHYSPYHLFLLFSRAGRCRCVHRTKVAASPKLPSSICSLRFFLTSPSLSLLLSILPCISWLFTQNDGSSSACRLVVDRNK